jgi:xylan 1,4-beta-xylosidase
VLRDESDTRKAQVTWAEDKNATGYIVNYGIAANKLYSQVMVYDASSVMLTALNKGVTYYYSIDAFNESGVTKGTKVIEN